MKTLELILSILLISILPGAADALLERKIPFSGMLPRATLGELVARASGWSEGAGHGSLVLTPELAHEYRKIQIDNFTIDRAKNTTFHDFLKTAFKMANLDVELEETKEGIKVTHLVTRRWNLSFGTVGKWKKSGLINNERMREFMSQRGWRYSRYFRFSIYEQGTFVARGTRSDIETVNRFINRSK